jgi:tellurite resistance protein TerA
MPRSTSSADSLANASKSQAKYSDHGGALGAGGVTEDKEISPQDLLDKSGESGLIKPPEGGFKSVHIGLAWNNIIVEKSGGLMGLLKKATNQGIDLDLGCFYELADGTRGILQPFGELFGSLDDKPYIALSGDERTGDAEGDDEFFTVNGSKWPEIKRILVYTYIYEGSTDWSQIQPEVAIDLCDGRKALQIKPSLKTSKMTVCALATLKNVKDAMQIVTHGEYFTSQAAMDRAFGFGLKWEDGAKN